MDIDRIGPVMKIANDSVFAEEVVAIEFKTAANIRFEFRRARITIDGPQRRQVVSGVEIVDPALGGQFAIVPGAVVLLFARRVTRCLQGGSQQLLISSMMEQPAQQ